MRTRDLLRRWRRLDAPGLEVFRLRETDDGVDVISTVVQAGEQAVGLSYVWMLDQFWRTRRLRLDLKADEDRLLVIERLGPASWRLDGVARPDLDGCNEIDVSATPFCNSLSICHLGNSSGELTSLYLKVPEMAVAPSRQRYTTLGAGR